MVPNEPALRGHFEPVCEVIELSCCSTHYKWLLLFFMVFSKYCLPITALHKMGNLIACFN